MSYTRPINGSRTSTARRNVPPSANNRLPIHHHVPQLDPENSISAGQILSTSVVPSTVKKEEIRKMRQKQQNSYNNDKEKFVEKEKEKAEKKRQERWKRYEHIDLGSAMVPASPEVNENKKKEEYEKEMKAARLRLQQRYDTEVQKASTN